MQRQYLITYADENGTEKLALQDDSGITALATDLQTLLQTSLKDLPGVLDRARGPQLEQVEPLGLRTPPTTEVWAAGVTYKASEQARERESGQSTIYTRVYDAERPELFHKAVGYDVMGNGDVLGIRYDATWNVPEPELTVVLNHKMQVFGFTVGNDMSSRDIEGANPLYLPQAKIYYGACALGPRILLAPGAAEYPAANIKIFVDRGDPGGPAAFQGSTHTRQLHRPLPVLIDYLGRCKPFPNGVFLMTGTGVVPPDDFTLQSGDNVTIDIEGIGVLTNPVRTVQRMI